MYGTGKIVFFHQFMALADVHLNTTFFCQVHLINVWENGMIRCCWKQFHDLDHIIQKKQGLATIKSFITVTYLMSVRITV